MSRWPVPGRTKSRLVPRLGAEGACALAVALLGDVLEHLADAPLTRRVLAFAERPEGELLPPGIALPAGWTVANQGVGDLGQRMVSAARQAGLPSALVGADGPLLGSVDVALAMKHLADGADVVFQPALDGGYTLVACARDPGPLMQGIAWGTDVVLDQHLRRASGLGWRARLLEPGLDVDVPEDLERLQRWVATLRSGAPYPSRTMETLARLTQEPG